MLPQPQETKQRRIASPHAVQYVAFPLSPPPSVGSTGKGRAKHSESIPDCSSVTVAGSHMKQKKTKKHEEVGNALKAKRRRKSLV
jgi:hypothetical protein